MLRLYSASSEPPLVRFWSLPFKAFTSLTKPFSQTVDFRIFWLVAFVFGFRDIFSLSISDPVSGGDTYNLVFVGLGVH